MLDRIGRAPAESTMPRLKGGAIRGEGEQLNSTKSGILAPLSHNPVGFVFSHKTQRVHLPLCKKKQYICFSQNSVVFVFYRKTRQVRLTHNPATLSYTQNSVSLSRTKSGVLLSPTKSGGVHHRSR